MSMTTAAQDIAVLTALNHDYITSVQRGDVRRFDEILAEDFLCSNPDGTLIDRAQFLAQTARSVTITGLVAEDVQIRLFGDLNRVQFGNHSLMSSGLGELWGRQSA